MTTSNDERRHETTVGKRRAWAGPWKQVTRTRSSSTGFKTVRECQIWVTDCLTCYDCSAKASSVIQVDGSCITGPGTIADPLRAMVLAQVLQEAALLAQGQPLEESE